MSADGPGLQLRAAAAAVALTTAANTVPLHTTPNPVPASLQLYDKRKVAALEVEQLVKQLSAAGNVQRISAVIAALVSQYATSSQVCWFRSGPCLQALACCLLCTSCTALHCKHLLKDSGQLLHVPCRSPTRARAACCVWQQPPWRWPLPAPVAPGRPTSCR